jgi:solute carrier family 45, member 1/2/4
MTIFAGVALLSSVLLPALVSPPGQDFANERTSVEDTHQLKRARMAGHISSSAVVSKLRSFLPFPWLTISRLWAASHALYSFLILSTSITQARLPSAVLVSALGICWAITQWAPLALISHEIANGQAHQIVTKLERFNEDDENLELLSDYGGINGSNTLPSDAGKIMGVYNIAVALPQIMTALTSSALFAILHMWKVEDIEAIGWVIRTGAVTTAMAAWFATRINSG